MEIIQRQSGVFRGRQSQRGMTLVIGLILLMMLVAISAIGYRNTTLSERMVGNSVDRNISFQSAENSGKEGLEVINAGSFLPGSTIGHYATPFTKGGESSFWIQGAGDVLANPATACPNLTAFNWTSCSVSVPSKYVGNKEKAQYAIEFLSQIPSGGSTIKTYRITSRSTGGSGDAEVVLQVIYSITTTP